MNTKRNNLTLGIVLLIGFIFILIGLFSPVISGEKPIDYLDNLYNSISKGSVYYIPKLMGEAKKHEGKKVDFMLNVTNRQQADEIALLFSKAGIRADTSGESLNISDDMHQILNKALSDADRMFNNHGDQISGTYGFEEKKAVYYWWLGLKALEKNLIKEKQFEEATFVNSVITRAVECAYNYYQVEPQNISTNVTLVVVSLVFYVVYTLWFGYAIMYIFIGLGLKLGH